jgi:LPXTG-site transpeptidase (sortase) family protein
MSVMTPRETSAGGPDRDTRVVMDAWTLCADFIEQVLADAQAVAGRVAPGHVAPEVDWDRIWRAGEGAPSEEAAIGRVIRKAWQVAQELAQGTTEPFTAPAELVDVVRAEPDLTLHSQVGTESVVRTEPATAQRAPVFVPTESPPADSESIAPLEEPVSAQTEPTAAVEEPVTAPVTVATTAVASVTLDRPDTGAVTVAEPSDDKQLPTAPTIAVAPVHEAVAVKRMVRQHSGWFRFFTWMEVVGAIMIGFVVWQLWGTAIAQGQAQDQLKTQFETLRAHHHPPKATAAGPSLIPAPTRVATPPDGSVVAELQIPAIGADQYVVEGTTTDDLSKGPGHYTGTAEPGQAGNVAIAGHRTTHGAPFNRLGSLRKGDQIILTTTSDERLTYIVSGTPVAVSPGDVSVLNYFGDNRITLTTCNPEFSSTQRLIAVGVLKESAPQGVKLPKRVTYDVVNAGTNSWVWTLLPVVGIEVCLLVLLGMTYRRFDFWFGRVGRWFVLVPLWAAGLYLLFDTLTKFLPASI